MTRQSIIEKIRKVLALAERAGTKEEAATAAALAADMMARYHIEEAHLDA